MARCARVRRVRRALAIMSDTPVVVTSAEELAILSDTPVVVTSTEELAVVVARCSAAERIAVDVEANGLHVYRAKLCVVQLAWRGADGVEIAIIDALAVPLHALAPILGERGPVKIFHDLSFDVRMLAEHGLRVLNVSDTSVAARFLGAPATGLASLVKSYVGVSLEKGLQEHDWSKRPFTSQQLTYLAADVRYLVELEAALGQRVDALGIAEEVRLEVDYKLQSAFAPPKDERPAHERVKGYATLDGAGKTALRRLCETRELLAKERDVPSFRVVRSELLHRLAERRPSSLEGVRRLCERDRGAERHAAEWLAALIDATRLGPTEQPAALPFDRQLAQRRKAVEKCVTGWRRAQATERELDAQVVVPGHCVEDVVTALIEHATDRDRFGDALAAIPGFGAIRSARYLDLLWALSQPPTE
ncbi:MAG: ribonuclease D [Myxococcales bacterium]|nr:ribonuclease D [Myxococcales bacterium]